MTQSGATRALCVLVCLALFGFSVQPARACTLAPVCGWFLPGLVARVPSNTPALVFLHSGPRPADVQLRRIDGDHNELVNIRLEPLPETFEYGRQITLVRVDALVEGARYTLEPDAKSLLSCPVESRIFEVGPKAELPTTLGELVATPSRCETIENRCPANPSYWGARSDLSLTIPEQLLPWRGILLYRLVMNHGAAEYHSDVGVYLPDEEVQIRCNEDGSSPQSIPYEVYFEAMIPGVQETLKTPVVSFELHCEKKPETIIPAAGAAGSAASAPPAQPAAEGCSASGGPVEHSGFGAWILILCALALARPRRQR